MAKIEWLIHENMKDQRIECRVVLIEGGRSRYAVQNLVDVRELESSGAAQDYLFRVFADMHQRLLRGHGVPAHCSTNPELARYPFESRRQFNRWLEGKGTGAVTLTAPGGIAFGPAPAMPAPTVPDSVVDDPDLGLVVHTYLDGTVVVLKDPDTGQSTMLKPEQFDFIRKALTKVKQARKKAQAETNEPVEDDEDEMVF